MKLSTVTGILLGAGSVGWALSDNKWIAVIVLGCIANIIDWVLDAGTYD